MVILQETRKIERKRRFVFLFNDVLLVTKPVRKDEVCTVLSLFLASLFSTSIKIIHEDSFTVMSVGFEIVWSLIMA